jgi:hypothetical protein
LRLPKVGFQFSVVRWTGVICCFVELCLPAPAQTSNSITIIITGTVLSGIDGNPSSSPPGAGKIFGGSSDLSGQPFTFTLQISDSEGITNAPGTCPDGSIYSSAITGSSTSSPPSARLQIGSAGGSFTYGALSLSSIGWTMIRTAKTSCSSYNTITLGWSEYEQSTGGDYTGSSGFGSVVLYTENDLSPGYWYAPVPLQGVTSSPLHFTITVNQATNIYNNLKFASGYLSPTSIQVQGQQASCSGIANFRGSRIAPAVTDATAICPTQPEILRDGVDITGTTQSVVVGQQIALTASLPVGATLGSQPWTGIASGMAVGGYVIASDDSTAHVVPLNLTTASTMFYWVLPGTFQVTFSCLLSNGQSTSVQATFYVNGPTAPVVKPTMSTVQVDNNMLGWSGTNGILFDGSQTLPPSVPGTFQWVQVLDESTEVDTLGLIQKTCPEVQGVELDGGIPYPASSDGLKTDDSPGRPLPRIFSVFLEIDVMFSARMFFMWKSNMPSNCDANGLCTFILVPLGHVSWGYSADVQLINHQWQKVSESENATFYAGTDYPEWSGIVYLFGDGRRAPIPCDLYLGSVPIIGRKR